MAASVRDLPARGHRRGPDRARCGPRPCWSTSRGRTTPGSCGSWGGTSLHVLDPDAGRPAARPAARARGASRRPGHLPRAARQRRRHPRRPAAHPRLPRRRPDQDARRDRQPRPAHLRRPRRTGSPHRTRPERRGQAFCELIERIPADRLPTSGGVNATVVVLLDYDTLAVGTGHRPARHRRAGLRRTRATAGVRGRSRPRSGPPLVDGRSVVLDLGRTRRSTPSTCGSRSPIEQGGCTAEHCDRPAGGQVRFHRRT